MYSVLSDKIYLKLFAAQVVALTGTGYKGHYMNAFGSPEDMLIGREYQLNIMQS